MALLSSLLNRLLHRLVLSLFPTSEDLRMFIKLNLPEGQDIVSRLGSDGAPLHGVAAQTVRVISDRGMISELLFSLAEEFRGRADAISAVALVHEFLLSYQARVRGRLSVWVLVLLVTGGMGALLLGERGSLQVHEVLDVEDLHPYHSWGHWVIPFLLVESAGTPMTPLEVNSLEPRQRGRPAQKRQLEKVHRSAILAVGQGTKSERVEHTECPFSVLEATICDSRGIGVRYCKVYAGGEEYVDKIEIPHGCRIRSVVLSCRVIPLNAEGDCATLVKRVEGTSLKYRVRSKETREHQIELHIRLEPDVQPSSSM